MVCRKCGSEDIQFIAYTEKTNGGCHGCLTALGWIFIICISLGIGLIFLLFRNSNKKNITKTRAVCKNCGHQWEI